MKYFVLNNGVEKQTTKKEFLYFVKEFGKFLMDKTGHFTSNIFYNDIENVYNPQGVLIAWKTKD